MMRGSMISVALITVAALSFGQSMMMSTNNAKGNAGTMMSANSMRADPVVGNQLRFASSTGTKVIFTTLEAAEAMAAKQPTVLFFAADWCPYCQADLKDINANGSQLGNVAIVVANYDTASDLKEKYGITVQDTFVQIDAAGAQKAIWHSGGEGVDGILSHIVRS
ncbi:MAG TPA: thioredoxin family protein [Spirochaetia bacterium]|nr:thioredoxin family protein [Spirochaetia bacterium]